MLHKRYILGFLTAGAVLNIMGAGNFCQETQSYLTQQSEEAERSATERQRRFVAIAMEFKNAAESSADLAKRSEAELRQKAEERALVASKAERGSMVVANAIKDLMAIAA